MNEKVDSEFIVKKLSEKWQEAHQSIIKANILVVGGTGVGKSTLINLVFNKEIAAVGRGKPETSGIIYYPNDYINIYDSEGYETGNENHKRFNDLIWNFIEKKSHSEETWIHLVWYCISAPSARVTDFDLELIGKIQKKTAVAVVLTQVDRGTKQQVESISKVLLEKFPKLEIFLTSIIEIPNNTRGLNALYEWSLNSLPEQQKKAFISVSNRKLDKKESLCDKIVAAHSATSAGIAAIPLPGADAPLLVSNQMSMIAEIAHVWDLPIIQSIVSAGVSQIVMTNLGRSLAGNILKCFPGAGSIIGGIVNAGVASALTYGLGIAINKICRTINEDKLQGTVKEYSVYFGSLNELFTLYFNKYKNKK